MTSPKSIGYAETQVKGDQTGISRQESIENLLVNILKQESMTTRQIVDCLMSEPYREANFTAQEIWLALLHLQEKKLLKLAGFSRTFVDSLDIEPLLRIFN